MVIRMTDSSNKKSNQNNQLRRTNKMRASPDSTNQKNTKAEFKRLKTILPSIRRKDNVSKLDIILEAIKYIDDLQDQLFDRLTGTHTQREATLLALTEQDMERSRVRLNQLRAANNSVESESESEGMDEDEQTDSLLKALTSTNAESTPQNGQINLSMSDDEDNNSHASLELWTVKFSSKICLKIFPIWSSDFCPYSP